MHDNSLLTANEAQDGQESFAFDERRGGPHLAMEVVGAATECVFAAIKTELEQLDPEQALSPVCSARLWPEGATIEAFAYR